MRHSIPLLRSFSVLAVVMTSLALASSSPSAEAALQTWTGQVTVVEDGDTFFVQVDGTLQHIRVAGVNTNEVNRSPKCYADEATARLRGLIEGRTVELRANNASSSADGRLVRHVFYNGQNMAELMLREGYGTPIIFGEQGESDYAGDYVVAYAGARRSGVGIHDDDRCGAGPRSDFPIRMTTNGDADGSDYTNVNGEFVRLRNEGSTAFSLTGWQLKDTALEFYAFPPGTQIAPSQSLTVRVGSGSDTSTTLYMNRTSPIFSGLDGAFLLDPDGDIRAQNTWPCVGLCGDVPVPAVSITGLNYDIPGNDDLNPNGEWFDLRNDGSTPVDLRDWRFESFPHSKVVETPVQLAPGATVRIRIGVGSDSTSTIYMNRTGSILNNSGDVVMAVTPDGDVAACESFGDSTCRAHPSKSPTMKIGPDFNGDGWSDVVGRSPGEGIGSVANAGAVLVRYGRDAGVQTERPVYGLSAVRSGFLSQSGPITGGAESGDEFGASTAVGDFNGDGYDDLAIGAPGEAIGSIDDAGVVHVLHGGPTGLRSDLEFAVQQNGMIAGFPEQGDRLGEALAAGDVDGDGRDDLAIGVPGENGSSGYVVVMYGRAGGGRTILDGDEMEISQYGSVQGTPESGDRFGAAIVISDLNGDGYADLVVGAPGEDFGAQPDNGIAHVLFGSSSGITRAGNDTISQGDHAVGSAERNDRFGSSLAAGDLNGDGISDLAVGAPGEAIGSRTSAGAVNVVRGGAAFPVTASYWFAQADGIPGTAESGDQAGATLSIGDIDNDGVDDLVVGSPTEDIGSRSDAGMASVVYGPIDAPSGTASFSQSGALGGSAEAGDRLGSSVDTVDHDGDNHADIIIGASGEDIGSLSNAGLIHIVDGNDGGTGSSSGWTQSSFGGGVEAGDGFGK